MRLKQKMVATGTMSKIVATGTLGKIVATGGVLIGGAAIVAAGAFATFTSTGQATVGADAGELKVTLTTSVTVSDMAPGDKVYTALPILLPSTAGGGNLLSALGMFIDSADGSHTDVAGHDPEVLATTNDKKLLADANGLTFEVITCSVAWTVAPGVAPTCSGSTTTASPTRTTNGTNTSLNKVGSMLTSAQSLEYLPAQFGVTAVDGVFDTSTAPVTLHSMIVFELPQVADNNYQNAATTFKIVIAALQRNGVTS
jgi:hypothetical protein